METAAVGDYVTGRRDHQRTVQRQRALLRGRLTLRWGFSIRSGSIAPSTGSTRGHHVYILLEAPEVDALRRGSRQRDRHGEPGPARHLPRPFDSTPDATPRSFRAPIEQPA
jgi:hypothetical protein